MVNDPYESEHLAPHSVEAEEAVLGGILLDPSTLEETLQHIDANGFFILRNAWVFEAILVLRESGMEIDNLTVVDTLRKQNRLDEIGGSAYITYLINSTVTALHTVTYARIVKQDADLRRLLAVASEIAALTVKEPQLSVAEKYQKAREYLAEAEEATEGRLVDDFIVEGNAALLEVVDALAGDEYAQEIAYRVPFPALWKFGGFAETITAGKVILLQGISGGGKTTIAEAMMDHLLHDGYNVLFWGGEWRPRENAVRRLQRAGGITYGQFSQTMVARSLHRRGIDTTDWNVAEVGMGMIDKTTDLVMGEKGIIATTPGQVDYINAKYSHWSLETTLVKLGRHIEKQRRRGIFYHCLAWDYAQLTKNPMSRGGEFNPEEEKNRVENAIQQLKTFCGQYDMFGLITSQVNKSATRSVKGGNALTEADGQYLRADANNLILSVSPVYAGDKRLPYLRLDINKNSTGRTGHIYLSASGLERLTVDIVNRANKIEVETAISEAKAEAKSFSL